MWQFFAMTTLVLAASTYGLWDQNLKLQKNIAAQRVAIEQQEEAIDKHMEDVKAAQEATKKLNEKFEVARKQVDSLEDKFNKTSKLLGKRDIGVLAINKPRALL